MKKSLALSLVLIALATVTARASLIETSTLDASLLYLNQFNRDPAFTDPVGTFADDGLVNPGATHFRIVFIDGLSNVEWDLTGTGFELHQILVAFDNTPTARIFNVVPDNFEGGDTFIKAFIDPATEDTQHLIEVGEETVDENGEPIFLSHITHVTFYGRRVPDSGTTAMLLGSALTALGMLRRFMRA